MSRKVSPSYLLFDLKLYNAHASNSKLCFSVSLLNSPAGNANAESFIEYDKDEKSRISDIALAINISDKQMLRLQEFGKRLFRALLPDEIGQCYRTSLQQAFEQGKGLRVRLRLESPQLIEIPWEYILDPATQNNLGRSSQNAISRYLDIPVRPRIAATSTLKILLVQSTPSDQDFLDVGQERIKAERAFQRLQNEGLVQIDFLSEATLTSFRQKLLNFEYHIIHFMGHGGKDTSTQESFLVLQDDDGCSHSVNADQLKELLKDLPSLRLVVLNACVSSEAARILGYAGIPAIVSMQYEVFDDSALVFSEELYSLLAIGWPIDAAVSEARKIIFLNFPKRADWVTPILYLRTEDGKIFDISIPEVVTQTPIAIQLTYRSLRIAIRKLNEGKDYKFEFKESPVQIKSTSSLVQLESIRTETDAIITHAIKGTGNLSPHLLSSNEQKRYGQLLFNTVFAAGRDQVLYDCMNKLGQDEGLRIQFEIDNDSYLRRIPWEFMHAGDGIGYLATSAQFLLYRTVQNIVIERKLSDLKLPLQMLIVFSEPAGVQVGCKDEEIELISALRPYKEKGLIMYKIMWNPSPIEFQRMVLKNYYHIIHFSGVDAQYLGQVEEGIVLSEEMKPRLMQVDELCAIFRGQNTARLLVLNTCLTATVLSSALVQVGVPSVIAMQFGFTVEAAVMFPKFFYPTLLDSQEKLQVDIAVACARSSYFIEQEHFGKNRLDWINPVLTTSVTDGNFIKS
jgi:CHAT domain-containing protein